MRSKNKSFLWVGSRALALQWVLLVVMSTPAEAFSRKKSYESMGLSSTAAKAAAENSNLTATEVSQLRSDPIALTASLQGTAIHLNSEQIVALGQSLRAMGINPENRAQEKQIHTAAQLVQMGAEPQKLTLITAKFLNGLNEADRGNTVFLPTIVKLINAGIKVDREIVEDEIRKLDAGSQKSDQKTGDGEKKLPPYLRADVVKSVMGATGLDEAMSKTLLSKMESLGMDMTLESFYGHDRFSGENPFKILSAATLMKAGVLMDQLTQNNINFLWENSGKTKKGVEAAAPVVAEMERAKIALTPSHFQAVSYLQSQKGEINETTLNTMKALYQLGLTNANIRHEEFISMDEALKNGLIFATLPEFEKYQALKDMIKAVPTKGQFEAYASITQEEEILAFSNALKKFGDKLDLPEFQKFLSEEREKSIQKPGA